MYIFLGIIFPARPRYHDSKKLERSALNNDRRKKLNKNDQVLVLVQLHPIDRGKYTCYVSTDDAEINRTISVDPTRMSMIHT